MPEIAETDDHRRRVLQGMAHAVSQKGYGATTIADIVREASVSRRTFYEHFTSKAECLIALYELASRNALKVLAEAIDPGQEWQTQLERAMDAYLGCMAASPVLVRTVFIEILHLGPEGLAARRGINREIAGFILTVVNARKGERQHLLSPAMAMAIVGGINELVLEYIEQDKVTQLGELVPQACELVRAITGEHASRSA